jgi:torulene dioxygenase
MQRQFESTINSIEPIELTVKGTIPQYAAGVLYRTGPGNYKVQTVKGQTYTRSHWFDGFSQVHRFQILPDGKAGSRIIYNSRFTSDQMMETARKTGKLTGISFAQRDPCESFFKTSMSLFKSFTNSRKEDGPNIGVTLSANMPGMKAEKDSARGHASGITTLTAKTDSTALLRLNPETLEPLGLATQTVLHPELSGPLSSAHAKSDPKTGDVFNFNATLGYRTVYRVFKASAATGKTEILARIQAPPSYIHSLFLTEEHVILCVWNSFIAGNGTKILWERNILDAISPFDSSKPATWYVVDRLHGRGLLATYESDAFFAFHSVNAWSVPSYETESTRDVVAEVAAYPSLDVLHSFYYKNLLAKNAPNGHHREEAARPVLRRFRLSGVPVAKPLEPVEDVGCCGKKTNYKGCYCKKDLDNCCAKAAPAPKRAENVFSAPTAHSPELPTMNPSLLTQEHRYTYGIADRTGTCPVSDGIVKFDWETREPVYWFEDSCVPGEPIFVIDPDRTDKEDGGVLLSVVLDERTKSSFLLTLDAETMTEIGRAEVGGVVGIGFHGVHVSDKTGAVDI